MNRPLAIPVLTFVLGIAAAIALGVGLVILFPGTRFDRIWEWNRAAQAAFARLGVGAPAALLILSVACAVAPVGLRRGSCWAWWSALAIFGLNGVGDVAALPMIGDWRRSGAGILVASAFLGVLTGRKVRRYCRRDRRSAGIVERKQAAGEDKAHFPFPHS